MLEKKKQDRFVTLIDINGNITGIKDNSKNKNITVKELVEIANIYNKIIKNL